ncbi:hypothetical protein MKW98_019027 [Papaver atlanticum]|uniref:Ankyrin repeat protein n=1 Tax=Papaver atlanticum TaxID=357466 RepID=A0AAD4TKZ0_9MAGN|nr:hypothetical protein MKW98_019027 [Papaver atlanticum]
MEKIYRATLKGDVESLMGILDSNPDLCIDDAKFTSFRRNPLHLAAMLGYIEFAEALLRMNVQLASVSDSQGFTPLHLASTRNNTTMVRVLLDANIGACTALDQDGRTPLHLAAMRDELKVMELLIENNPAAIFQVENNRHETILHLCVKHDKLEALKKLVDYLVYAPGPNSISTNSRDIDGNTILHLASESRQMKV